MALKNKTHQYKNPPSKIFLNLQCEMCVNPGLGVVVEDLSKVDGDDKLTCTNTIINIGILLKGWSRAK